jgi:DNA-binding LacI/PurR family transcriptional regulator
MATIQDVAQRAGVSTATVSKVISNTPYVSEKTRAKVIQAIQELDYKPNLAARGLSSGRTHIVAVVFPYVYEAFFTDPLVLLILQGIESEITVRGYNILLSTPRLTISGSDEHYQSLLQSGYIEGLIAIDNVPEASALQPARERNIPSIAIGYHPHEFFVRSDDYSGGQQLMRHVLDLGHRKIGIVEVPAEQHFSIAGRAEGMRAAAEEAGVSFESLPMAYGDFSVQSGADAAAKLLREHPDLTALVCLNDRMAMGAIQAARAAGRDVPGNLTVVGYDDIPAAATFAPPLTTVNQQGIELGRAGARMLFDVLDGQKPHPIHMPTMLVVRESSSPPTH